MSKRKIEITEVTPCSDEFQVLTTTTSGAPSHAARRKPCEQCPWRMDVPTGVFPPKAFQKSASTAHDASFSTFACHMEGIESLMTCAGFLLRHSENNLMVRIARGGDRLSLAKVTDGGLPLYPSYREMAIANGVDPNDPCLAQVRANDDYFDPETRRFVPRKP